MIYAVMQRQCASIVRVTMAWMLLVGAVCARPAQADGQLQDFIRIRGMEGDVLVGMGLIVGLDGTGDAMKDSSIAGQPYAELVKTLGNVASTPRDYQKLKSVAIVYITLDIPSNGARIGDRLDVHVSTLGNAKSLKNGQLVSTYLVSDVVPADRGQWVPYAMADGGPVEVGEAGTVGIIRGGARVVRDIVKNPFDGASVVFVLKPQYVGLPAAAAIADEINQELATQDLTDVAVVEDASSIRIRIPPGHPRAKPHEFIANLLTLSLSASQLSLPSAIVIDKQNKVMTIDERVEFRAVAITVGTLRITTITPPPEPTPENPIAETSQWVGVGTGKNKGTSQLKALIDMLRQLDVPFESQVAVVESLKRMRAISAEIIYP